MRDSLFGLAACAVALLACNGTMGLGSTATRVGPNLFAIECRRASDCYSEAWSTCPYGYDVRDSGTQTTGAIATSNKVGNQTYTNVTAVNRTDLVIQCRAAVFCTKQSDCAGSGMRCIRSQRYPGKAVCADR